MVLFPVRFDVLFMMCLAIREDVRSAGMSNLPTNWAEIARPGKYTILINTMPTGREPFESAASR